MSETVLAPYRQPSLIKIKPIDLTMVPDSDPRALQELQVRLMRDRNLIELNDAAGYALSRIMLPACGGIGLCFLFGIIGGSAAAMAVCLAMIVSTLAFLFGPLLPVRKSTARLETEEELENVRQRLLEWYCLDELPRMLRGSQNLMEESRAFNQDLANTDPATITSAQIERLEEKRARLLRSIIYAQGRSWTNHARPWALPPGDQEQPTP